MKVQETLSDIEHAEEQRRAKAHTYQCLTQERDTLARGEALLNKKLADLAPQLVAFDKMLKVAETTIPSGLMTPGRRGFPGGEDVKFTLVTICERSIETLAANQKHLEDTLATLKARQKKNKAKLAAEFPEA